MKFYSAAIILWSFLFLAFKIGYMSNSNGGHFEITKTSSYLGFIILQKYKMTSDRYRYDLLLTIWI